MKFNPFSARYRLQVALALFLASAGAALLLAARLHPNPLARPANFLAAHKGYGVNIDLTRYPAADLPATLTQLQANGLTWLRQPVRWAELEPQPGQFDWRTLDRVLAAVAHQPGPPFKLIAVLRDAPGWARAAGSFDTAPPQNLSDFGRFAGVLAARYGDKIEFYQIWDEPNISSGWGRRFVEPEAYANLLREGALNIRAANPAAVIVLAALAPTLESSPLNLTETEFLERLYRARAERWFEVVAVQPYGFDLPPTDPARAAALNFRRAELVRQVMLAHGAADTPVWATAFGWAALPAGWSGQKSPWESVPPDVAAQYTAAAVTLARQNWPWLGPLLAARWDAAGLPATDPARGLALSENPPALAALRQVAVAPPLATVGRYPANHPTGQYSPGWRLAATRADIPRQSPVTLTIPFEGTRLDLAVQRGPYRGYLWVKIDGQPANALPQDGAGRSYAVLYNPQRQTDEVTLAQNLPPGPHSAQITAAGGWGQWAILGWAVATPPDTGGLPAALVAATLLALCSGVALAWRVGKTPADIGRGVNAARGQLARLGEWGQIGLVLGLGAAVYVTAGGWQWLFLALLLAAVLLRPDLGLALIAFGLSFVPVFQPLLAGLSLLEWLLLAAAVGQLCAGAFGFRLRAFKFHPLDWPMLALLLLALLATVFAQNFGVSMHEFRTVVLAAVVFYGLVRRQAAAWPLADALAAGAAAQAVIALYLYFFTNHAIPAEGVYRAVGPAYSSPNHLALFLGRVWPILLAVAALPGESGRRRAWYAAGLLPVSAALYFTFSRGALLLGLPVAVTVMVALLAARRRYFGGRRALAAALLAGLALVSVWRTARVQSIFSENGTAATRFKLWLASLHMLRDHWLVGVGLDNFLYQYRTRYMLPAAWAEPELSHPHNYILDFGTRLGIGGVAVLIWLQTAFWRAALRAYRRTGSALALGLMGSMAVFLSHGLVDNSYFLIDLALLFSLTAGLAARLSSD